MSQIMETMRFQLKPEFGKSIARPKFINEGFIHYPQSEGIISGYKQERIGNPTNNESVIIVHLRNLMSGEIKVTFYKLH